MFTCYEVNIWSSQSTVNVFIGEFKPFQVWMKLHVLQHSHWSRTRFGNILWCFSFHQMASIPIVATYGGFIVVLQTL